MVIDFLKKYQEELISQKIDTKEGIDLLNSKINEEVKFLSLLEQNNESYYSVFTPRNLNEKNNEKAVQIKENITSLQSELEEKNNLMRAIESRLQELNALINNSTSFDNISFNNNKNNAEDDKLIAQLSSIKSYILLDPRRAETELDSLISSLKGGN